MPASIQTNFEEAGVIIFKADYGQYAIFADTEKHDDILVRLDLSVG